MSNAHSDTQRTSLHLPNALHLELKVLAEAQSISMNRLCLNLIEEAMASYDTDTKEMSANMDSTARLALEKYGNAERFMLKLQLHCTALVEKMYSELVEPRLPEASPSLADNYRKAAAETALSFPSKNV